MRLPPIAPADLLPDQRRLFDEMQIGVAAKYQSFETKRADGAFFGPWNVWLHDPAVGSAFWGLSQALTAAARIPDAARQIAILVVGNHFQAAYEIYAHEAVARDKHGMDDRRLAGLASGIRPADLGPQEAAAYDVATTLVSGGVLPPALYDRALAIFGQAGANELIFLVGYYAMLSMTLNGFDVAAP